jgi:hypothetical protein
MTENDENARPPDYAGVTADVAQAGLAIITEIMTARQWGTVSRSFFTEVNGGPELHITFRDGTRRRVRFDEDGAILSDRTGPTKILK